MFAKENPMKKLLIMFICLLIAAPLFASTGNFTGKYVFNHPRYVKTLILDADGSGNWSYHNNKSSAYDYDERIVWHYDQGDNQIVVELVTQDADGRIQKKGQKFQMQFKDSGLQPQGSEELFAKQ